MDDKASIRERVWDGLEADGVARFPFPPHGRIPNFEGAKRAAERLSTLAWWEEASTLKCNPDAPQRPVRERALAAGKTVVMAVPRLAERAAFLVIDPAAVDDPADAATLGGADEYGRPVEPADVPRIEGIVTGCVAVDDEGRRIGKGEGYADLEFAILLECDRIDRDVTVATTVHGSQLCEPALPQDAHDVPVDLIATPETVVRATDRPARPGGVDWDAIDPTRREHVPVLETLASGHDA